MVLWTGSQQTLILVTRLSSSVVPIQEAQMTYIHLNLGGAASQLLAQCQAHRREISRAAQRCGPWFPTL